MGKSHGSWQRKEYKGYLGILLVVYTCSECGNDADEEFAFCPHCGKPMNEKAAELKEGDENG